MKPGRREFSVSFQSNRWAAMAAIALLLAAWQADAGPRDWVYVYKGPPNPQFSVHGYKFGQACPCNPIIPTPGDFFFINRFEGFQGKPENAVVLETHDGWITSPTGHDRDQWRALGFVMMRASEYPRAVQALRNFDRLTLLEAQRAEQARIAALERERKQKEGFLEVLLWILGVVALVVGQQWLSRRQAAAREQARLEEAERTRQAAEVEAQRLKRERDRESARREIEALVDEADGALSYLSDNLGLAERQVEVAEKEFEEGAFAPFWDAVEEATKALAEYKGAIDVLAIVMREHEAKSRVLGEPSRGITFRLRDVPEGMTIASRLQQLVRMAQKDFQFSSIYEQRKTNKILIAGFETLASALYSVRDAIRVSISELATTMGESIDELRADMSLAADGAADDARAARGQAALHAKVSGRQHEQVIRELRNQKQVLDDIRRRRKR